MTHASARRLRLAVNPIPYWARDGRVDKSPAVLEEAFADFQAIGFTAVKADLPPGMAAADYRRWIGDFGLTPALSLCGCAFDETVDMDAEIEKARRFAGEQTALGLDRTMVSAMSLPARMAEPGVGAGFDAGRLSRAIENLGRMCVVLQQEGLRPLLHSHVGGIFETEDEVIQVLDGLGPDVIGFGPDTGHLALAGADPAALIARYADRVGGIHIKDCFADYLRPADRAGLDYRAVNETRRLWAEPGLGVIDLAAVLAALPSDYDGDVMIEVDVPSVDSRRESHQISYAWATAQLPVGDATRGEY